MSEKYHILEELTWTEAKKCFEKTSIAMLPLGATEQHGYHLPLGTDTFLATELCTRVAEEINAIVLPSIPIGYSWVWKKIPGTISLSESTMETIIKEIACSLNNYGVKYLIIFTGHEANSAAMKYATRDISEQIQTKLIYFFYPGLQNIINNNMDSKPWNGIVHAAEFETSLMLATHENLVNMKEAQREYPPIPSDFGNTALPLGDLSKSGVYGDATVASKEKGELFFELIVKKSVKIITDIITTNKNKEG